MTALAAAPLSGGLVSGCFDGSLGVWDVAAAEMKTRLEGHKYQVNAVGVTPSGALASAASDATAKIWRNGACAATLEGHEAAVLSLTVLPGDEDTIATGSGDTTIKVWAVASGTEPRCLHTLRGHRDSVRSLAVLPGVGLVSGSHDLTIKVWTAAGEEVATIAGHTGIIYSVAVAPDGGVIASGAEDNTARVWRLDGTALATLEHPGCVWAVAFLPNGDLVTACSDGVARVWTQEAARYADADAEVAFQASLAAYKEANKPKEGGDGAGSGGLPDGLKIEDPAVLLAPGGKNGQIVVVKEGDAGVAYSWDAVKGEWDRIGEVVSGAEGAGPAKKWHEGKEWDYVIDVEFREGSPPLKLAGNNDENPYIVADRFLEANELPNQFKDQIVAFIEANTGATTAAPAAAPGAYVDPFTGASAYVPPPAAAAAAPAPVGAPAAVTGGGVDPFTGGGAVAAVRHLPARAFLLFEAPPPAEGLRKKMAEFSAALAADPVTADLAVSEADMGEGGAVGALLAAAAAPPGARTFDAAALTALLPRLLRWPPAQLFPCLDLARVVALDPAGAAVLAAAASTPAAGAPPGSLGAALAAACTADPPVPATQQVAMRCMANCFAQPPLQAWAREHLIALLTLAAPCAASQTKGVRLGLATLLVNVALALTKLPGDELQAKFEVVALGAALLGVCPSSDEDARYR